jgi:hypothetical protein
MALFAAVEYRLECWLERRWQARIVHAPRDESHDVAECGVALTPPGAEAVGPRFSLRADRVTCPACRWGQKRALVDEANAAVTHAILVAEQQKSGTAEYVAAWWEVEKCEQRIADLTAPDTLEGEIARRGVLSARKRADDALVEALAALEHDRWSRWETYRESVDSPERRAEWRRKRETQYAGLTHEEQESDREEARRTIALLREMGALGSDGDGMSASPPSVTIALHPLLRQSKAKDAE